MIPKGTYAVLLKHTFGHGFNSDGGYWISAYWNGSDFVFNEKILSQEKILRIKT